MAQKYINDVTPARVIGNGLNDINQLNVNNASASGSLNMPSLEVYKPDYGALQSSFDEILKSFQGYKDATKSQFDANKASLDLNLEQSIRNIGEAGEENKQAFTKGRQQVAEDIYSANRANTAQMSARGLGGSGVEALANLQTRMQAGETVSDMAGEFFDAQEKLVQAEADTRANYNNQLLNLNSSLQSAMAQIASTEASTKMDYTQNVENLKRQVIADTNMAKQAQYEWQLARSQMDEASKITNTMVQQVLESDTTTEFKVSALKDFGYPEAQAKTMVAQQSQVSSERQGQATREQMQTIQKQIDNYVSKADYKPAQLQTLMAELIAQGVDVSKLNLNGTSTAKGASATSYSDADLLAKRLGEIISGETIGNSPYIGIKEFFTKKNRE